MPRSTIHAAAAREMKGGSIELGRDQMSPRVIRSSYTFAWDSHKVRIQFAV